jgi:hypothetical protein
MTAAHNYRLSARYESGTPVFEIYGESVDTVLFVITDEESQSLIWSLESLDFTGPFQSVSTLIHSIGPVTSEAIPATISGPPSDDSSRTPSPLEPSLRIVYGTTPPGLRSPPDHQPKSLTTGQRYLAVAIGHVEADVAHAITSFVAE